MTDRHNNALRMIFGAVIHLAVLVASIALVVAMFRGGFCNG